MDIIINFWHLFELSAPWLLLGLLVAGVIHVFIPKDFLSKHLGKEGFWTTIKAALIGAPMPLCSCGVIPAAIGLRRAGGSKSATTAFLVSTPETGVDSISVSYALLGPFMAVIRPIAAVCSAIVAGLLVGREKDINASKQNASSAKFKPSSAISMSCCAPAAPTMTESADIIEKDNKSERRSCGSQPKENSSCCMPKEPAVDNAVRSVSSCCDSQPKESSSCCAPKESAVDNSVRTISSCCDSKPVQSVSCCAPKESVVKNSVKTVSSCCDSQPVESVSCCASETPTSGHASIQAKLVEALKYSSGKLLSDTMVWLLVGLFFASLIQTYVPPEFLGQWGSGILAMTVVILISIPMYICATASTPIAAGLLLAGVSPGAVLVFMLAGPATNIATIGVVAKELGRRAVLAYLTGVIGVAIAFGFLTDYLVEEFGFNVEPVSAMEHDVLPAWFTLACAVLLAALMLRLFTQSLKRKFA